MNKCELSAATINDIMEKVPQDKWETVISELLPYMSQLKRTIDLMKATAKVMNVDVELLIDRPDSFTWVDDGKRDNEFKLHDSETDSHIGSIEFKEI